MVCAQAVGVLSPEQEEILSHMSIVELPVDVFGNSVRTIRFSGVNVQVVNGTGATDGPGNGHGNLVVGKANNYSSWGGQVVGERNPLSGYLSIVSGGYGNTASGRHSMVSGGVGNTARGERSTVGGGGRNTAAGEWCVVSGGNDNTASGIADTVGGGWQNEASGDNSTVSGGLKISHRGAARR